MNYNLDATYLCRTKITIGLQCSILQQSKCILYMFNLFAKSKIHRSKLETKY